MTSPQSYDALVSLLEHEGGDKPGLFFSALKSTYKLDHVVYADLIPALEGYRIHRFLHDANDALEAFVTRFGLSPLTSFLDTIFDHASPFEIVPRDGHKLSASVRRILLDCGLLPYSVFFPLATPQARKAFFSVHASLASDGWQTARRAIIRDIPSLATQFHGHQIDSRPASTLRTAGRQQARLTPREREALGWAAAGKNYWEIATIMGISERTVRHFMASVRFKLDTVSNKQAVAEAVLQGLITRPGDIGP